MTASHFIVILFNLQCQLYIWEQSYPFSSIVASVYKLQHFQCIFSSNLYSNVTTSTRINSSNVHTYIHVCFIWNYIPIMFSNGLLTNNSTWCQNRGCICISSTRRTYGWIHSSFLHTIQSSRQIILWTELFSKEEEREDPRRELQSSFQLESKSELQCFHTQSILQELHIIQQVSSHPVLELILLQEISKKYYNYKAHPMYTDRRHPPASVPRVSKHSSQQNPAIRPLQHKQAPSSSTRQKEHSKWQTASTQPLQHLPGKLHKNPLGTTEFYQEK